MIKLNDKNKSILVNELRPDLEEDDIYCAALTLYDIIDSAQDLSSEDSPTHISAFLYELGIPLLENVGDTVPNYFFTHSDIESVEMPSKIKRTGIAAFSVCKSLRTVQFNEGLEDIEDYSFAWCTSLNSVVFPSTLKHIGLWAFARSDLSSVTVQSDAIISDTAFEDQSGAKTLTFYVPENLYVEGTNLYDSLDKMRRSIDIIVKFI